MNKSLRNAVLGLCTLVSVFNLAACAPSPEAVAAHNAALNTTVAQSLENCDRSQGINMSDADYSLRLRQGLQYTPTETLNALQAEKITICLDQRLPRQQDSWNRWTMETLYYPAARVVSLPDDGQAYIQPKGIFDFPHQNPLFNRDPSAYLNRLKRGESDAASAKDGVFFGHSRKPPKRSRRYYWEDMRDYPAYQAGNSWILKAPVAPKPPPAPQKAPGA